MYDLYIRTEYLWKYSKLLIERTVLKKKMKRLIAKEKNTEWITCIGITLDLIHSLLKQLFQTVFIYSAV